MGDSTSETDDVDAGWGEDDPPPTREAPSTELRRIARSPEAVPSLTPVASPAVKPARIERETPVAFAKPPSQQPLEMRATVPPPVPASEYVATMMGQVPESELRPSMGSLVDPPALGLRAPRVPSATAAHKPTLAERHRAILQTLHEEDPLRFDFEDIEKPAPTRRSSDEPPSIETRVSLLDDAELLKETKPPVVPSSGADDFDELPVDEVLGAVSTHPPARPAPAAAAWATRAKAPPDLSLDPASSEPTALTISDIPIDSQPASRIPKVAPLGAPAAKRPPPPPTKAGLGARALAAPRMPAFPVAPKEPVIATKAPSHQPANSPRNEAKTLAAPAEPKKIEIDRAAASVHERATIPGYDPNDPMDKVHDRFVVGDYSGALALAEAVLEKQPNHVEASKYATDCREMLRQMFASKLGDGTQVPRVVMGPDQLRWLTLDHRAGFLLSCIDGSSSIDEILDVSGMASIDALRILAELLQEAVIEIGAPPSGRS